MVVELRFLINVSSVWRATTCCNRLANKPEEFSLDTIYMEYQAAVRRCYQSASLATLVASRRLGPVASYVPV